MLDDCRPHSLFLGNNALQKKLDTLRKTLDGSVLGLHHLLQVELDIANLDTALFRVVQDLVVKVGVVQQRFRGNASDVQAGATESAALLNASSLYLQAQPLATIKNIKILAQKSSPSSPLGQP